MSEILVKFCWSMRRSSDLVCVFATTRARLAEFPGMAVSFGEAAGKHSEVYGRLKAEDFAVITDNASVIAALAEHLPIGAVSVEDGIESAIEGFPDGLPGEPSYEEAKAKRDALRCIRCGGLPREQGGSGCREPCVPRRWP